MKSCPLVYPHKSRTALPTCLIFLFNIRNIPNGFFTQRKIGKAARKIGKFGNMKRLFTLEFWYRFKWLTQVRYIMVHNTYNIIDRI